MPEQRPAHSESSPAADSAAGPVQQYLYLAARAADTWLNAFQQRIMNTIRIPITVATAVLACHALLPYLQVPSITTSTLWLLIALYGSLALGFGLGTLIGRPVLRRLQVEQAQLRQQIHDNLVNGGLLSLALEHAPFERLPSLQPWRPWPLNAASRVHEDHGSSMTSRLKQLARSYASCARHLGLDPYPGALAGLSRLARLLVWLPVATLAAVPVVAGRSVGLEDWFSLLLAPGVVGAVSFAYLASLQSMTTHLAALEFRSILIPAATEPDGASHESAATEALAALPTPLRNNQADG